MLLVKDILSISKEQVSCSLEDFTFVDILLHCIHLSSYVIQMIIHQLYDMKMIEDMHGTGTVLKDRGDEGDRQICSDMLNLHLMPLDSLPELVKCVNSLSVTHIENPSRVKIYDNGLVYVTFPHSKLINADVHYSFQGRRTIVALKIDGVNLLYCVP